ncbi:hypothetical protein CYMTET_9578 [Cymbomonas tetramitiformis]|uniref:Sulfatase-modifying factor enzyme-like domain-containing protein n=1 Tax=Cymbomonas tetramitiformis TaxID=36881 RepID=A0AAE0GR14_9CHLO|nr:hypothetical protein CYMTET_9578 [Cymbomonas tetramitiformis]
MGCSLRSYIFLVFVVSFFSLCSGEDGDVVEVKSGVYSVGADDEELVKKGWSQSGDTVRVKRFSIDKFPVTNFRFRAFVRATKYKTEAEDFGWSFVFSRALSAEMNNASEHIQDAPWWKAVQGAYWRQPEGKGSSITQVLQYPVVHVSKRDAEAFCKWEGKRLATEHEWEVAARGGYEDGELPWAKDMEQSAKHSSHLNSWHGRFPDGEELVDGFMRTSPVDAFPPQNSLGLHDMLGNVWEWTSSTMKGVCLFSRILYRCPGGSE